MTPAQNDLEPRRDVEDVKRELAEVFADVRQSIAEREALAASGRAAS